METFNRNKKPQTHSRNEGLCTNDYAFAWFIIRQVVNFT